VWSFHDMAGGRGGFGLACVECVLVFFCDFCVLVLVLVGCCCFVVVPLVSRWLGRGVVFGSIPGLDYLYVYGFVCGFFDVFFVFFLLGGGGGVGWVFFSAKRSVLCENRYCFLLGLLRWRL